MSESPDSEDGNDSEHPAFETTYGCSNCGNEWDDQHPPRTVVTDVQGYIRAMNVDCTSFGECDDYCHTVRCPVCDLFEPVHVKGRSPITGGDDTENDHD